jgi:hypothetical protein
MPAAGSACQVHGVVTQFFFYHTCLHSQVLMLDADSLPLLNPEQLFHSEPFASSGNLFWPGGHSMHAACCMSSLIAFFRIIWLHTIVP